MWILVMDSVILGCCPQ